jgi:hypothetical protein
MAQANSNEMDYVYGGIGANGYHAQVVMADSNNVYLVQKPTPTYQYGIRHINCVGNKIMGNTVSGPGWNVPVVSTSYNTPPIIIAIGGNNNMGDTVSCNYTTHTNTGFEFIGTANITTWNNNLMDDHTFGLVLGGMFGPQGNVATFCGDLWGYSTATVWTGSRINTLTIGLTTVPTSNQLFVMNNPGTPPYMYNPTNNRNSASSIPNIYSVTNGITVNSGTPYVPACEAILPTPSLRATHTAAEATILTPIVTSTLYTAADKPLNWIAQENLLQLMIVDSGYTDSSAALAQFQSMVTNSRHVLLYNIENTIANGGDATALINAGIDTYIDTAVDSATGVIMADGVEADYIVSNYLTYYSILQKYRDTLMTGDDTTNLVALANLCAYTNGNVVYKAQALYRVIFEDFVTDFNGNCFIDTSDRRSIAEAATAIQGYKLSPNPNDGSFALRQAVNDATPVNVTVKDMFGRNVFTQSVQFVNGMAQLQLGNLATGVYMLQLADSNQKVTNFKFVVQK